MAGSPELAELVQRLRSRPFDADTAPIAQQRAAFEAFAATFYDPPQVVLEACTVAGTAAEWAHPSGAVAGRVVVWVHGGGFTLGSITSYRDLAARVAVLTRSSVLTYDYRLAPEHPFPAALDDTVGVVREVMGSRSRVVVGGDSVGAGIAVAAAVALRDRYGVVPHGLALVSAKADLTQSGRTLQTNAAVDPVVSPSGTTANARRYLGGGDPRDPLASPVFADLTGLPPTHLAVGTAEVLLDDSLLLARRLRDAGVSVDLDVWPDMIHILPFFAARVPEARRAMSALADAVRTLLAER
ncbi:MAG: alpha/beta hydrolase [Frankiales bacterium]|nr:alpha/beta hydrolase [Frankiales bacterium]